MQIGVYREEYAEWELPEWGVWSGMYGIGCVERILHCGSSQSGVYGMGYEKY